VIVSLEVVLTWIVLFFAIPLFVVLSFKMNSGSAGSLPPISCTKQQVFLSFAERDVLGLLEQILGPSYRVFVKVRLADLVVIRPGQDPQQRSVAAGIVARETVSFAIFDQTQKAIVAVIDLTEGGDQNKPRNDFVDQAMGSAEIPYGRIPLQLSYSRQDIEGLVNALLEIEGRTVVENEEHVSLNHGVDQQNSVRFGASSR